MKLIDCESTETAWRSVCDVLGISQTELRAIFDEFASTDSDDSELADLMPFDKRLERTVIERVGRRPQFEACWFHLTRVPSTTNFSDGIRSLGEMFDPIWEMLRPLAQEISDKDWSDFRRGVMTTNSNHYAMLYRLKTKDKAHWGPNAMLIRGAAFCAVEIGNHNYLNGPEIVEDICFCFKDRFNIDLLNRFRVATKPCVVKFVADGSDHALSAALLYLYRLDRRDEDTHPARANTCWFSKDGLVPKSAILRVDFPDYGVRYVNGIFFVP
jgi:hypothetical protein